MREAVEESGSYIGMDFETTCIHRSGKQVAGMETSQNAI